MADFTPQMLPPINASAMGGMIPFISPDAIAQNQADMLQWQQRQALAQQMMQAQYQPNTGRAGIVGNVLERVMGQLANNQQNAKLSDILKQQFQIENQAASAKRQQDLADEYRKLQENIYEAGQKAIAEAKAKRENPEMKVENGFVIDPSNPGASTAIPGYSDAQIALAGGKANAEAAARARYAGADAAAQLGQVQRIMAMPDSPVKQAMLTKALGEGGMQALQMSSMFGGGGGGGQGGPVAGGPTGDDYLKTLPPATANEVKALAEGRMQFPNGMAMRSQMGQQLLQAVSQYDPAFDAVNYGSRAATRKDFTSGKDAQTVNALNTAIGHLGHLSDLADTLGNTQYPAVNSVLNTLATGTGSDKVTNFNTVKKAVVDEVTRVYRGAGGSQKDIEEGMKNLSEAGSPAQLHGAVQQLTTLMGSKLDALNNQYNKGMGTAGNAGGFLDQKTIDTLKKIQQRGGGEDIGIDLGALAAPNVAAGQLSDADLLKKYGGG